MKHLLFALFTLVLTSAASANVDSLLGEYRATDRDGVATVYRKEVAAATLFEPAKYNYYVEIIREKDQVERTLELSVAADGASLKGRTEDDCDDPDCHAFSNLEAVVFKNSTGRGVLAVEYEGYITMDGEQGYEEFSGSAVFIQSRQ